MALLTTNNHSMNSYQVREICSELRTHSAELHQAGFEAKRAGDAEYASLLANCRDKLSDVEETLREEFDIELK